MTTLELFSFDIYKEKYFNNLFNKMKLICETAKAQSFSVNKVNVNGTKLQLKLCFENPPIEMPNKIKKNWLINFGGICFYVASIGETL